MDILKDCDIVVDVGAVYDPSCHRYDHHQRSFDHTMNTLNQEYPWTVKLSSAGLVYFHFGHEIIANILKLPVDSEEVKILYGRVYENFIQEIDAIDNGVKPCDSEHKYDIHTHLSSRVKRLNPSWTETNPDETKCFEKACQLVEQEFLDRINFYGKTWLPARDIVKSAVQNRFSVHSSGEIIDFASGGCPWKEHLFELEESLKVEKPIKFVIYPDTVNKRWRIQCVSVAPFSFENRLSLCKEWCGLQGEELNKKSGIDGCVFVHMSGFIGGNKTREGALQMALKTLNPE
ncbi:UPF0160 protein MYG1, mitochondrial [Araneus ventricosus]|uniref:UPF0160 protein MYG1, mitochondrial n=1 Tax=Araneus ventricosus TaxID=182803 RepID=A0A4Y2KCE4_ARAVE|nr:UPF0160 protein MYG1, mitochondrial [Araneus ventricosus]